MSSTIMEYWITHESRVTYESICRNNSNSNSLPYVARVVIHCKKVSANRYVMSLIRNSESNIWRMQGNFLDIMATDF